MTIIVSADAHWGIGKNGGLLAHIPADMQFFKATTMGGALLMGRKTLDSLPGGRPLPGRLNLVLTSDRGFSREGVTVCHSVDSLLTAARATGRPLFVIGGGSVYAQLLPYCRRALVTRLEADLEADTFFPDLDREADWQLVRTGKPAQYRGLTYFLTEYQRNSRNG